MTTLHATFIGTATVLFELRRGAEVIRLLTDPVFDGAGARYRVGGLGALEYASLGGPAVSPGSLPAIDAVLLSHDHHGDNFDSSGREVATRAARVFTTQSGARRLQRTGLRHAQGLAPWQTAEVRSASGSLTARITATPARHGPPFSLPIVGPVIGFLVEWSEQPGSAVWVSGDTLWHRALEPLAERDVGFAFLHVGAARFRLMSQFRYTMNAHDAVRATQCLAPHTLCPIHYEGWSHFSEGRDALVGALSREGLADRCVWLPPGQPVELRVRR